MINIHYVLYGETVEIRIVGDTYKHREILKSHGYTWESDWSKTITGRDLGIAEAKWLKTTFPEATLIRDVSGGGVA